jgi:hypothetical protein
MAGLFQVLWGQKGGGWKAPETLCGSDGEPLIITPGGSNEDGVIEKICTRPTAVDLDGDGRLDIVSGNFLGTFAVFAGAGSGKFAPKSAMLDAGNGPLKAKTHSDPFFVDWDRDGDLDLVTGSAHGGVFLYENRGSAKAAKFTEPTTLLEPGSDASDATMGDAHVKAPGRDTRVWVDDVNGDGKLDLLVGDAVRLMFPAKGVDEATALKKLGEWQAKEKQALLPPGAAEPSEADMKKLQQTYEALQAERKTFVRDDPTGFVWVLYRK